MNIGIRQLEAELNRVANEARRHYLGSLPVAELKQLEAEADRIGEIGLADAIAEARAGREAAVR